MLLASVRIESGEEAPFSALRQWGQENDLRLLDQFDKPLEECVIEDIENEEGYFVAWHRPETSVASQGENGNLLPSASPIDRNQPRNGLGDVEGWSRLDYSDN